uniref:ARSJ protein n=1 Tax=Homo sapiens TaxID=9606 RepID=Q8N5N6_HUMAN
MAPGQQAMGSGTLQSSQPSECSTGNCLQEILATATGSPLSLSATWDRTGGTMNGSPCQLAKVYGFSTSQPTHMRGWTYLTGIQES